MDHNNDLPNLDHWKQVMEFTVEQAALLLAGIDPLETETLAEAKNRRLSRWKQAWTHSLAIVSAIRQGVVSPVLCRANVFEDHGEWSGWTLVVMKPSDRDLEISTSHTIITRASLVNWVTSERVQFAGAKPSASKAVMSRQPSPPQPSPPEPLVPAQVSDQLVALPYQGHKSEGLEFVEDAIKQMWSTYDQEDPSTAPTQAEVVEYLKGKGAGANMADAVNLILRPASLRRGGRKNK